MEYVIVTNIPNQCIFSYKFSFMLQYTTFSGAQYLALVGRAFDWGPKELTAVTVLCP